MRVTLLEPEGTLTISLLMDVLSLVCDVVPRRSELERWTPLELQIAYDWAIREHLYASNNRVQRRARPYLLDRALRSASVEAVK